MPSLSLFLSPFSTFPSFLSAIFGSSFGVISIYFAELTICQVLGLGTKSIDEGNTWQIKVGKMDLKHHKRRNSRNRLLTLNLVI